jgi:hypothetical protein
MVTLTHLQARQLATQQALACLQEALRVNLINQQELEICFDIVDARNITSHTYNEHLAEEIFQELPQYHKLMQAIFERMILITSK